MCSTAGIKSTADIEFDEAQKKPPVSQNYLIDWLICFGISVLPIILLGIFVDAKESIWDAILSNGDMLFVCVSLASSALFEISCHKGKKWQILRGFLLIDIIASCFLYIMVEFSIKKNIALNHPIRYATIGAMVFTLVVGVISFILSSKERD